MSDTGMQTTSTALRANLAETRCDVVVPPEYDVLLEAVDGLFGVRQATETVLREYFHPLRDPNRVVDDLAALLEGRFGYFAGGPDPTSCIDRLVSLLVGLHDADLTVEARSRLVRTSLDVLVDVAASKAPTAAGPLLDALARILEEHGTGLFRVATLVRSVGRQLPTATPAAARLAALYRDFLQRSLAGLRRRFALGAGDEERRPWPVATAQLVRTRLDDGLALLAGADAPGLYDLPTLDDVVDDVLRAVGTSSSPAAVIDGCIRLASFPELEYRVRDVLQDLDRALAALLTGGDEAALRTVVDSLTDYFRSCPTERKRPLFTTLERLGRGLTGDEHRTVRDLLIERLVAGGFEGPDVAGVSEDWQVLVNPHHLPLVRTWLAVIEADPAGYERLLSALVANLHFRGIFVSDTDLFQRDITTLLAAGVGSVFNLVLQLVAFVPVFFNDIGSEGSLRDVSTRLDQLTNRSDSLTHFLRKQCHAESNNRLVAFSEAVLAYWMTGDPSPLAPHVPPNLLARLPQDDLSWYRGARAAVGHVLAGGDVTFADLRDRLTPDELHARLAPFDGATADEKERVVLLVRLHRLLAAKYSYGPEELHDALAQSSAVDGTLADRFRTACRDGDDWRILLEGTRVMGRLKAAITSPDASEAREDIYLKRHIAVGIPSMYGTYHEPKFDAMGQLIRVMSVMRPRLERLVDEFDAAYMTKTSLLLAYRLMRVMLEGLEIEGLHVEDLSRKVELLKRSLWVGNFSATQFRNVVEFIAEALGDVIQANYIGIHEANVRVIARTVVTERGAPSGEVDERADGLAETFLRSLIAGTYGLQCFDRFVGLIRRSLETMTEHLDEDACRLVLNYSQDKLVSFVHHEAEDHEDQLILGAKGLTLKRLRALGLPVPEGFIVSTELFNILRAMHYDRLRQDTRQRIRSALTALEADTGLRLGDGRRPLLVSVRSGAAVSMPGMMDTVINVGLTRAVAEAWAAEPGMAWTAWDCYRRYVQSFAMSRGVERNRFDAVMLDDKRRCRVERKLDFTPAQMRDLALRYERLARDGGVEVPDEPFEQVMQALLAVVASWDAPTAVAYRRQLHLSDGWGTAVIVQRMVLGNLSGESGTGALFTTDPQVPSARVELFGDFVTCSQGEDVVSGLVHPFPISEKQRQRYAPHLDVSLERLHPRIFRRLTELAEHLVHERGFEHQEMEFTFEQSDPDHLFVLQSRPLTGRRTSERTVFCDDVEAWRLSTGVGVAGGALSGRVAFTEGDIAELRRQSPDEPIILLRPDTVPEDIPLVMSVDGLLTARGGVTSHASVTAKRLGKPCVVNCRDLLVAEDDGRASLGALELRRGSALSLDGSTGAVYEGAHDTKTAQRTLRLA